MSTHFDEFVVVQIHSNWSIFQVRIFYVYDILSGGLYYVTTSSTEVAYVVRYSKQKEMSSHDVAAAHYAVCMSLLQMFRL